MLAIRKKLAIIWPKNKINFFLVGEQIGAGVDENLGYFVLLPNETYL